MAAGLILAGLGTGLELYGMSRQARMAKIMGRRRNQYLQQTAQQTKAAGQRAALEERRQAELLASRAVAVAAAGGRSGDMSVSKIISDIEGEGAYREAVAMYNSEEEAKKLLFEGKMAEYSGEQEAKNIKYGMIGTVLSGGASMYRNKYK